MAVAEIVSILQSQGDYDGAAAELTAVLELPALRSRVALMQVFRQKLMDLQVVRNLLLEKGLPFLPFEQIPAEWSDELEQRLFAGDRVQS
jgi:hypothetical protein